jgi:hypothetical protein
VAARGIAATLINNPVYHERWRPGWIILQAAGYNLKQQNRKDRDKARGDAEPNRCRSQFGAVDPHSPSPPQTPRLEPDA